MKPDKPAKALVPVSDALASVLAGAKPLAEESVELIDAFHRTLSRDVTALRTQPADDVSAMDGYAVIAGSSKRGSRLRVIGESAAGKPYASRVGTGEAVRIFTGAVIPPGADAVVIQEDTTRAGDNITLDADAILSRHIRYAGIDFREGDVLLTKGTRLTDRDLSLAASMNHARLPVHVRPKIALLATGDELVLPGSAPLPGQTIRSNGYALHALLRSEGADVIDLGIVGDDLIATRGAIREAINAGADILLTTGGASVGDHDLVKAALEAEGTDIAFWQIALRPGKPMMHGQLDGMRIIGVPGNPVSSYVCTFLFVIPLLRALSGQRDVHHVAETATLGADIKANDHRQEYLRATLEQRGDAWVATPVIPQDSSLLGRLALAKALIVRLPHAPVARSGDTCRILRLPA